MRFAVSPSTKVPGKGVLRLIATACSALPLLVGLTGCNREAAKAPERRTPEVVVSIPAITKVSDYEDFTGRLDGLKMVEVRARVTGFILTAPFKEGDLVHEGDRLFTIDPQTYKADFDLAAANLKLAKADLNLQQKVTARARVLMRGSAMAQEDYDTAVATAEKSQATIEAMSATKDRAKLYVDYTLVNAPLTGRVSRRFVDPGNLVNADNTVLTTIVGDEQLYAYFDVDERCYLNLIATASASAGKSALADQLQFPALLRLANEEEFSRSGMVNFVDNRVNANTGTIRMRAIFNNPNGALRAGLFVRIRLPIGAPYEALMIPDEAILSDQGRKYVYVDDEKDEVSYRIVTLGQEMKGQVVVKSGLKKTDRVIVEGLQRIRPGIQVTAEVRPPAKTPVSPLNRLLNGVWKSAAPAATNETSQAKGADSPAAPSKLDPKTPAPQPDRLKK